MELVNARTLALCFAGFLPEEIVKHIDSMPSIRMDNPYQIASAFSKF